MGTPVEPGEKGDDCLHTHPAGETPKYLLCVLEGMSYCGLIGGTPPNGSHILTQSAFVPCLWEKTWGDYKINYSVAPPTSTLRAWYFANLYFRQTVEIVAAEHFANEAVCPEAPPWFIGGTGYVDLYDFPARAYQQAHDFNLMPIAYTKFEVYGCPDEPAYISVRRFGNVRTPTNIAIKFDATHYDQWDMFEKED